MKKIGCLILALAFCTLAAGCRGAPSAQEPDSSRSTGEVQEAAVRDLVTGFGGQLQKVSLLAAKEAVASDMQKYYGEYVSPSLLKEWQSEPSSAPGRLTSSPWPDRIEILSVEKQADDAYDVTGEIIEKTSADVSGGQQSGKQGIKLSVQKIGGRWMIVDVTLDQETSSSSIVYRNDQYGFSVTLPSSWKGYTVLTQEWQGYSLVQGQEGKITETGPEILVRHPEWTKETPRQDIPILVFTPDQWNALGQDKFHIGAAPIGPSELARNSKYVFALPARYNFAFPAGYEEVDQLLQGGAVQAIGDQGGG
ncbi:hypothetical protein EQM14_12175 [Caproiciproducens sp. NJN-50]|uniref:hypothetical protein n=1 Tax=Acutalibacteraceae TaxID=3082771 RepID=UPI000FFE2A47|nr:MULTISPECIES: hypothetical protein [Acutalibacteraceae]QAT50457.1 hypothetical protein EQM14_12175 [Caproiciproducens sp. NJN-50]